MKTTFGFLFTAVLSSATSSVALAAVSVDPLATFYDGSDAAVGPTVVNLSAGTTSIKVSVTGSVVTDNSSPLNPAASADGLAGDGSAPFNFTNTNFGNGPGLGRHNGVPIGGTTGIDPALFGIFFSPSFAGVAPDSLNFRFDEGLANLSLTSQSPALNQPFFIGDGFTGNLNFGGATSGTQQTFFVPAGATQLLLGIGADDFLQDNIGPGFAVEITSVPLPAALPLFALGIAGLARHRRRRANRPRSRAT